MSKGRGSGFSLIELLVVVALFGVLALAGTNFLVSVIQSSNRAAVQNEVRQSAQNLMQAISRDIRGATSVSYSVVGVAGSIITINNALGTITYQQSVTGGVTRTEGGVTSEVTTSKVAVCVPTGNSCGATSCATPGIIVACRSGGTIASCNGSVDVTIKVQQKLGTTAKDFCGQTTLTDTISLRLRP